MEQQPIITGPVSNEQVCSSDSEESEIDVQDIVCKSVDSESCDGHEDKAQTYETAVSAPNLRKTLFE